MLPPGVVNGAVFGTLVTSLSLHSARAASPAAVPSSEVFFQTLTVWLPRATLLRAAMSPSWPPTATLPASPWPLSAATTPPAMPSFSERTASILLLLAVRICSIWVCATSGFQPSVNRSAPAGIGDRLGVEGGLDDLLEAVIQEAHVRIGLVALHDRVVARRLGLQDLAGDDPPDLDVVVGQVEDLRVLDQAVVGDDRDPGRQGGLDRRDDRLVIEGVDEQDVDARVDQRLDVRGLGRGGVLAVGRAVRRRRPSRWRPSERARRGSCSAPPGR